MESCDDESQGGRRGESQGGEEIAREELKESQGGEEMPGRAREELKREPRRRGRS